MGYRPSIAGFELNAGSAFAGIVPAIFKTASLGTALGLVVLLGSILLDGSSSLPNLSDLPFALAGLVAGFLVFTMISAIFCGFYIALVGAPLAWLMGPHLNTKAGLVVTILAALGTGLAATAVLGGWPTSGSTEAWSFIAIALAYALSAGLFYRSDVLTARTMNRWSDSAA